MKKLHKLIALKQEAMRKAKPKSRDKLRSQLRALQVAVVLKRECRKAA